MVGKIRCICIELSTLFEFVCFKFQYIFLHPLGFGEWQISLFLRLIQALTSLSDSYVRAWKSFITEISPKPIRGLDCCVSVLLLQQSTPPPQLSGWKHHLFVDGVAIRAGLPGDGSSLLRWCQLGWLDSRWKRHFHTWPSSHGRWVGIGSWLSFYNLGFPCKILAFSLTPAFLIYLAADSQSLSVYQFFIQNGPEQGSTHLSSVSSCS